MQIILAASIPNPSEHPILFLLVMGLIAAKFYDAFINKKEAQPAPVQELKAPAQAAQTNQTPITMKQFKIYENSIGLKEAVKQGWSWPAFFFSAIWAFIKKMNEIGGFVLIGWIVIGAILGGMMNGESEESVDTANGISMLLGIAVCVIFGVNGNAWREKNLIRRGYQLKGTVTADSDEGAVALYCQQQGATAPKNAAS